MNSMDAERMGIAVGFSGIPLIVLCITKIIISLL